MNFKVLESAFAKILGSGLVVGPLTVVWHAGEPLVVPSEWYEEAFAIASRFCSPHIVLYHTFQSNGTLLTPEWVSFLMRTNAKLSLSIDGPAWIHDQHRVTRAGQGTHARSMRGLRLLQDAGISPAVLTVLTAPTLNHPDVMFDFYRDAGIEDVAFNVEELEGAHSTTSMTGKEAEQAYRMFMARFIARMHDEPGTLRLRELSNAIDVIRYDGVPAGANQEAEPMRIISISADGSVSTFSPEFLGMRHAGYHDYVFGNILCDTIEAIVDRVLSSRLRADIATGIANCRRRCPWFKWCGGGTPSNKVYEAGSPLETETSYCRLTRQALLDVVLTSIEKAPDLAA